MTAPEAIERAVARHRQRWGEPTVVVRAPGRVNLIGEHTDYNDGFTLPMALPFDTAIAVSDTGTGRLAGTVEIDAAGFGTVVLDPSVDPRQHPPAASWATHLAGVIALLAEAGVPTGGWRATIDSDIPVGAGLSSSAALEVAAITALVARAGRAWTPVDVARLGQRVENEVVGLPSGIMDQLISAGAVAGHASLMDCRTLQLDPCPIPADVVVAVMDTGTRRTLADAADRAYADRRASCERAARQLAVDALRDADVEALPTISDPVDRRRAQHVVSENGRTLAAAAALRGGDARTVGELMAASHASLRDDYEVSGPALDVIVEIATAAPGCHGARMTGGGFAGCAVALVERRHADDFTEHVIRRWSEVAEGTPGPVPAVPAGNGTPGPIPERSLRVWTCRAAAGAQVVSR